MVPPVLKVLRPARKICAKECNPNLNMNRSEASFNELVAEDTALRRVSIVTDSSQLRQLDVGGVPR